MHIRQNLWFFATTTRSFLSNENQKPFQGVRVEAEGTSLFSVSIITYFYFHFVLTACTISSTNTPRTTTPLRPSIRRAYDRISSIWVSTLLKHINVNSSTYDLFYVDCRRFPFNKFWCFFLSSISRKWILVAKQFVSCDLSAIWRNSTSELVFFHFPFRPFDGAGNRNRLDTSCFSPHSTIKFCRIHLFCEPILKISQANKKPRAFSVLLFTRFIVWIVIIWESND